MRHRCKNVDENVFTTYLGKSGSFHITFHAPSALNVVLVTGAKT